jgi:diguanylate cyclase (GGDEF)-like protein
MRVNVLKPYLVAAAKLFCVTAANADLRRAQFEVMWKQILVLYFIVIINSLSLAYIYALLAPALLTVAAPMAFSVIGASRMNWWLSQRRRDHSDAEILRALRSICWLSAAVALAFTFWCLALYRYGDQPAKVYATFYMLLTVNGCILCFINLRPAALTLTIISATVYVVSLFVNREPFTLLVAANYVLVAAALASVLLNYYQNFADLVVSRKSLVVEQAATQALSDANFRLANLDALTELPNRRSFFAELAKAFAEAERTGARLAVGIVDLDGFKSINDTYGHVMGDQVLIEAARRIGEVCEGFGSSALHIARLGGDEFGVLAGANPADEDLIALGRQIAERVKLPYPLQFARTGLSCSIGFAVFPNAAASAEALYERADYALYHAKRHLRGQPVVFTTEHEAEIRSRSVLERLLRAADFDKEMALAFQPIVDVESERTVGFEVLARWTSPELGRVTPSEFIPVAEHIGLIRTLTRTLLAKALAVARTWPEEVRISFNLSAHDVCSPEGVLPLIAIIQAGGVSPRRIDFEITETAVMCDFDRAEESILALKALGCGISLDDFGTGYSSLGHVHRLPIDKLKVDRSFVADINGNPTSHKIIKSVAGLCADMDMSCVIEGVENQEQLDTLRALGCALIQGYYFARPMPQDAVSEYLAHEWERMRRVAPISAQLSA